MKARKPARQSPTPGSSQGAQPAGEAPRYEINDRHPRRVAEPAPSYKLGSASSVVTATEAARRFSDLVNRASYQGETFVIERGGKALCQLGPLQVRRCSGADLLALLTRLPRPDEEFLAVVETSSRDQSTVETSPWDK